MKNLIIISFIAIFIVVAGVSYRFLQVLPGNIGTGEIIKSPNGKYQAVANDCHSESFWGKKRHWYEFKIEEVASGKIIQRLETDPIDGPYFGSRSKHKVTFWSDDSKEVVFKFPKINIKMRLEENTMANKDSGNSENVAPEL
jgi:hypothetical protein